MRDMNRKVLKQSAVAFFIGIFLYIIGDIAGFMPGFLVPLGILCAVGGVIGWILSLIIQEAQ